jgi:hypothetical protein
MMMEAESSIRATCRDCRYFVDDPHQLERMFPGILALSSTYGSSRGDSGVCLREEIFLAPEPRCEEFELRIPRFGAVAPHVTER